MKKREKVEISLRIVQQSKKIRKGQKVKIEGKKESQIIRMERKKLGGGGGMQPGSYRASN